MTARPVMAVVLGWAVMLALALFSLPSARAATMQTPTITAAAPQTVAGTTALDSVACPSTSSCVAVGIVRSSSGIVVDVATTTQAPTTTTVTIGPASPGAGQPVTVTAQVRPEAAAPAAATRNPAGAATATPGGTVSFFFDGSQRAAATIPLASGGASLTASFAGGTHTVTAAYSGDADFAASTSTVATIVVATTSTTATTSAPGLPFTGQNSTLVVYAAAGLVIVALSGRRLRRRLGF